MLSSLLIIGLVLMTTNNVRTAYKDLLSGTAQKYDAEMKERYEQLSNCTSETCVVPLIQHTPRTIFAHELARKSSEEEYYYNECIADYFYKPYIMVHDPK